MNLEKSDWYFGISVALALLLASAPMYIVQDWVTSNYRLVSILFILLAIIILIIWLVYRYYNINIISDGLSYIYSEIDDFSKKGGVILSTAIFEDSIHDGITEYLDDNINAITSDLTFKRLVLLDNPALEFVWIRNFLNLKSKNNLFYPIIYHVTAIKRPVVSKIIKSVPNIGIVVFYDNRKKVLKTYLGFKGGSKPFGISIGNARISKLIEEYLNKFILSANELKNTDKIPSDLSFSDILFYNIIAVLEDENYSKRLEDRDEILFIGAFGSSGLLLQKRVNTNSTVSLEGDLDLLFYLSSHANKHQVKEKIVSTLETEYLNGDY